MARCNSSQDVCDFVKQHCAPFSFARRSKDECTRWVRMITAISGCCGRSTIFTRKLNPDMSGKSSSTTTQSTGCDLYRARPDCPSLASRKTYSAEHVLSWFAQYCRCSAFPSTRRTLVVGPGFSTMEACRFSHVGWRPPGAARNICVIIRLVTKLFEVN